MEDSNVIIKNADLAIKRLEKMNPNDHKVKNQHEFNQLNLKISNLLTSLRRIRTTIEVINSNAIKANKTPDISIQLLQLNEFLNEFETFIKENGDKIKERRKWWQFLKC